MVIFTCRTIHSVAGSNTILIVRIKCLSKIRLAGTSWIYWRICTNGVKCHKAFTLGLPYTLQHGNMLVSCEPVGGSHLSHLCAATGRPICESPRAWYVHYQAEVHSHHMKRLDLLNKLFNFNLTRYYTLKNLFFRWWYNEDPIDEVGHHLRIERSKTISHVTNY